mgnify:CR=1 FL=1
MKNSTKKIRASKKNQSKSRTPKKRKTITAPQAQAIRGLAEQLGKLIALEGFRSSFSLTSLAKKRGLSKYLPKKSVNKKESFFEFLKNLQCHKPRTIKILIREILPIAIEKRHAKGDPVLEAEAIELSNRLITIGINLKSEILALNLPKERPKTVPPPIAVQKILDTFTLHPTLLPDCKDMFINGHINESVRKALERFEKLVQDLSGVHNKQGADLMAQVFNEQQPKIKVNTLTTTQEINKQIGFKFIAMGIMHWWRNNLSHGDEEQVAHYDALGRLILITNLIHELDQRIH